MAGWRRLLPLGVCDPEDFWSVELNVSDLMYNTPDGEFMTPEERFAKIEENLLVTSEMQIRSERRWKEQIDDLREVVHGIGTAQVTTQKALDHLIERQLITDATLQSLITSINQFVQGRGGDGHSSQG
jgi:hypothetical protein